MMKNTLNYLKQLEKNNNRDWFNANKPAYEQSYAEMIDFAEQLIQEMNGHDQIETVSGRKSLFRIYRDVRFSKDKTPYKSHWGGFMKRATASLRGGYYYHIKPGDTYIMGGFFNPNKDDLLHIRKQIAQDSEPLRDIIQSSDFKKYFGELRGEQLKTAPKGFDKEHPDIDLLRYKQFLVRHDFKSSEVQSKTFPKIMSEAFFQMRPFFSYMSEILTTDLNGVSLL